jgi:hypothetical protein
MMAVQTETLRARDNAALPGQDAPLRLRGGWLVLGRVLYASLLMLCLVLFGLSL